jgi:hypothetical protein
MGYRGRIGFESRAIENGLSDEMELFSVAAAPTQKWSILVSEKKRERDSFSLSLLFVLDSSSQGVWVFISFGLTLFWSPKTLWLQQQSSTSTP